MSQADRSIDPKLLECAEKEFLEKGFEKASLRNICKEANVTTGALYKRFNGKEELFSAIVGDTASFLFSCMDNKQKLAELPQTEEFLVNCWDLSPEPMLDWFRVMMDNKKIFILLLKCSAGTQFENFEHDFATRMSEANYLFYRQAYEKGITSKVISKNDLHIIDSAYWKTVCEPIIHDYTWDEIVSLTYNVCSFMNYYELLGIDKNTVKKYGGFDMKRMINETEENK